MTTQLFAIPGNESRWDLPESHWPVGGECPHVFVQRYDLPADPAHLPESFRPLANTRLYLFGHRVPDSANRYWITYSVIETRPGGSPPILHDLHQSIRGGDGVFFSTDHEHARHPARERTPGAPTGEEFQFGVDLGGTAHKQLKVFVQNDAYAQRLLDSYVQAGRPKNARTWIAERIRADFLHSGQMPRWTEDEGNWPFVDADPMLFVAQTMLPENTTTSTHLSFNEMQYLFVGLRDGAAVCKLYRQSVGTQTADAHYRFEELVSLYQAHRRDPEVLQKVVHEGDRFVHQYLLDQSDLPTAAITFLARHAANKDLRTRAAQRLKAASSA